MKEDIVIVTGYRTPFCKARGALRDVEADDLGAFVVKELVARSGIHPDEIDELIFGNVIQPHNSSNIARVLAVRAGLPVRMPAYTVNRNCASGMEAIASAADKISLNEADTIIAGGTESMSNFSIVFKKPMKEFLTQLYKAKTVGEKLKILVQFRPSFMVPEFPEIGDPICGLSMGQTAEVLAREFHVSREEQDLFALMSQERATAAIREGRLGEEIIPVPLPPRFDKMQLQDEGPRENQTLEALGKLKPAFEKVNGTVTAGNASQVTDGAVAILVMRESKAKEKGFKPLGYIRDYASAGLDPRRMGLGPAFATSKVLKKTGLSLKDFDLIEINEAFAGQVLAVRKAMASAEFAKKELGRDEPIGEIELERLNVNGGAVALGHPLGASGARLVLTLLKELKRRNNRLGLATLCVGGGQGQAMVVEVAS